MKRPDLKCSSRTSRRRRHLPSVQKKISSKVNYSLFCFLILCVCVAAIDQPLLETDLIRNSKKPNSLLSTQPTYLLPANQYAYFCHKYVVATQKNWLYKWQTA